jgi:hypothetical protein
LRIFNYLVGKPSLRGFQYPARIMAISCKGILNILAGYYNFAGRILKIRQERFWILTALFGKENRQEVQT